MRRVLRGHNIEPSLLGERPPVRWLDGDWQPEPPDLRALIVGQSFVIGAGFDAERIQGDALARST